MKGYHRQTCNSTIIVALFKFKLRSFVTHQVYRWLTLGTLMGAARCMQLSKLYERMTDFISSSLID